MILMYENTLLEKVLGIKIRTFGFKGHFKKRSLIIMNHVTHFDWLFFWSVIDRHGDFPSWKAVMKEKPLKQLPILGMSKHIMSNTNLCPFIKLGAVLAFSIIALIRTTN